MDRARLAELWERGKALFLRCRPIALVLAVGLILLLLPMGGGAEEKPEELPAAGTAEQVEALERKMEEALSEIHGAGDVKVLLTAQSGPRQVLAQDSKLSGPAGERSQTLDTVVLSRGSGRQETVPLEEIAPRFRGALVICHGGEDPGVRLHITEAVGALTGLGADKIVICKGN